MSIGVIKFTFIILKISDFFILSKADISEIALKNINVKKSFSFIFFFNTFKISFSS